MSPSTEPQKQRARVWFEALRNDICAAFEALEDELGEEIAETLPIAEALRGMPPGRFERKSWTRAPQRTGVLERRPLTPLTTSPSKQSV